MKKITVVFSILSLIFALSVCGKTEYNATTNAAQSDITESTDLSTQSQLITVMSPMPKLRKPMKRKLTALMPIISKPTIGKAAL